MTSTFRTPGVYVEERSALPPSIVGVDTALPVFIGYTQKADRQSPGDLHRKPTRIYALAEYEQYFGSAQPEQNIRVAVTLDANGAAAQASATLAEQDRSTHLMHYALQLYFAAGGGECIIVSVNPYLSGFGSAPVVIDLQAGIDAIASEQGPTLIVFPEAQALPIAQFKALHDAALAQCAALQDRFLVMDVHGGDAGSLSDPRTSLTTATDRFRANGIGNDHLAFGAAYAPNLVTNLPFAFDATKTAVTVTQGAATSTLMLDALPAVHPGASVSVAKAIAQLPCRLPPAAAIAGLYVYNDRTRGVWKAPANLPPAPCVTAPAVPCSDADQQEMNVDPVGGKSVNAIRQFPGKGTLVWGARTLAGNDNEWRYVSVRRLLIFIEQSVKLATAQFAFEPNDAKTWTTVRGMVENFLIGLWKNGALQGAKPDQAFFVSVGLGQTMTQQDILDGRMIVEIGVAAVRPAEFVVVRISQMVAQG